MNDPESNLADFGRATRGAIAAVERFFVAWSRAFASKPHLPEDVYGDQSRAMCLRCGTDWPCDEWMRLHPEAS